MASGSQANAAEIDRLALALAKDPASKSFIPLAEEYGKAGMWPEAAGVLEDGLKYYPGFITAMVALGRAYDQMGQPTKAKAILEEAIKISPENLRAHRTLAKIYTAEGSTAAALRSCDVILALNPLDQESLSLRASLGASTPAAAPAGTSSIKPTPVQPQALAKPAPVDLLVADTPPVPAVSEPIAASTTQTVLSHARDTVPATPAIDTAATEQLTAVEIPMTPESTTAQTSPPAASRMNAPIKKLEQLLQSVQTRRRDRPSQEITTTSSPS
jgi:tetratricopeptide (TPR) repeat protein